MFGFGATGQFAIGEAAAGVVESIFPDKWFIPLAEPVRYRLGQTGARLLAGEQQFLAIDPAVIPVSRLMPWFHPLSEPVRALPALKAGIPPFLALNPLPRVSFSWFEGLAEPARSRPALPAALRPFFAIDTSVIPVSKMPTPWFVGLSEPVRFRSGLSAARQQFLASPSRLLPTPAISGVLAAIETKDTMLAGIMNFNRVVSGEIGVIESKFTGAQIGVAIPVIAGARVAITIV